MEANDKDRCRTRCEQEWKEPGSQETPEHVFLVREARSLARRQLLSKCHQWQRSTACAGQQETGADCALYVHDGRSRRVGLEAGSMPKMQMACTHGSEILWAMRTATRGRNEHVREEESHTKLGIWLIRQWRHHQVSASR